MPLVLLNLGEDESFSLFDNQENKVFDFFGVFFYRTEYLFTSPLFGEKKNAHICRLLIIKRCLSVLLFISCLRGASLIAVICWKLVIFTL